MYAHLFPDRVGRFVFDSVIEPERHTSGEEGTVVSAREESDVASEATLAEFFRLCAEAAERCGFGAGDPAGAFDRLIERLRAAPVRLTARDGQALDLDESLVLALVGGLIYQPVIWEALALSLQQTEQVLAETDGELATTYATSVLMLQAEGLGGVPYGSINPPFYAVTCTDTDHPGDADA